MVITLPYVILSGVASSVCLSQTGKTFVLWRFQKRSEVLENELVRNCEKLLIPHWLFELSALTFHNLMINIKFCIRLRKRFFYLV